MHDVSPVLIGYPEVVELQVISFLFSNFHLFCGSCIWNCSLLILYLKSVWIIIPLALTPVFRGPYYNNELLLKDIEVKEKCVLVYFLKETSRKAI